MPSTPTTSRPDTSEMVIVHAMFRREFGALPGLVRGVPAGDTARAAVVVAFLDELVTGLHHHHSSEDELMWPLLLERDAADSDLIRRMQEQHERIGELNEQVMSEVRVFALDAAPESGERLAAALTLLTAALDEHLGEEENQVLPLVEQYMTVQEWEAFGRRGREGLSKERLLVQLGYLLNGTSPEQRDHFLGKLPLPARLAWRVVGRRQFAADYRKVHGRSPAV